MTLSSFGFRFGGSPPGGNRTERPAPGPGAFIAPPLFKAADLNADEEVTPAEMKQLFAHWFEFWNTDKSGMLTEEQLRQGIDDELMP
jgi:hypothetical protein